MKNQFVILTAFLVLSALIAGCTGGPATDSMPPTATTATRSELTVPATPSAPPLVGTSWKLGWYDDTKGVWSSVIEGSTITALFSSDNVIMGSNGCIDYTTEYKLLAAPGIWIRRPAVPETSCSTPTGVGSQQSAYYTDLMNSETYTITGNQLQMFDKTGKKILQFDPVS